MNPFESPATEEAQRTAGIMDSQLFFWLRAIPCVVLSLIGALYIFLGLAIAPGAIFVGLLLCCGSHFVMRKQWLFAAAYFGTLAQLCVYQESSFHAAMDQETIAYIASTLVLIVWAWAAHKPLHQPDDWQPDHL